METNGRSDTLALEVSAVGSNLADIELSIAEQRTIVVFAHRPSRDADALAGFLSPLLSRQDGRSDWQAMRDSWRLRHFTTCFGMLHKAGYNWRVEEMSGHVSVAFEPPDARSQG
jgi:hypothetical protein